MANSTFYFFSASWNSFQQFKSIYTSDYTKSPLKVNKLWDSHINSTPLREDEIPDLKHFIAIKHPLDFENPYEGLIQGFNLSNRAFEVVSKFKISGRKSIPPN